MEYMLAIYAIGFFGMGVFSGYHSGPVENWMVLAACLLWPLIFAVAVPQALGEHLAERRKR